MKRFIFSCLLLLAGIGSSKLYAQEHNYGYFNSVAVGLNVGTTGIGFDVATPIGNYLALRAGVDFMPGFSMNGDVDVSGEANGTPYYGTLNAEGTLKRTSGNLLLNVYPFKSSSFFVAAGAYFGGSKLVQLTGHTNDLPDGGDYGIEIGDYTIPVDENGNVSGGLKVAGFRPYLGLGIGRLVPKNRINVAFEVGVQFHGTPKVYSDTGDLGKLVDEADNEYTDLINKLTVYPVLKLRLSGRIF
ncbi:hypothetical protein I6E10_13250 [Phocaeicola barnesiae]|uniref:hypothetical protein n=1 Tax=Phocaeicola barnesiae TaxID=376804 RepID=UPI001F48D22C|nr:hypothetical protein [Phocaeicola barnesiae]MCF2599650.1 hypothetical protein [Phocaeicola barnesiae]